MLVTFTAQLGKTLRLGTVACTYWCQIMDNIDRLTAWDDNLFCFITEDTLTCKTMITFTLSFVMMITILLFLFA